MSKLQEIRTQLKNRYSVNETASYMGVSKPTYHKWERDPRSMTLNQAIRLADYLQCSVDDFFFLDQNHK